MHSIFLRILDMSWIGGIVILMVMLCRLLLKKAPKIFSYVLWAIVLIRLLCPVVLQTPISVIPRPTSVSQDFTLWDKLISQPEAADQGDDLNVGQIPTGEKTAERYVPADRWILFGQYVWVLGMAAMLLSGSISYLKIRKRTQIAVPLRENIFLADDIRSPFVMGIFRPRIYLPCNLNEKEQGYILLHERHHIRRLDHIFKALAFFALILHWFNPLVWAAFVLAEKDMEMSCDEAVIRKVGADIRADYAASLLTLATGRRIIAGTPLAFGEGNTKGRIRNLSKWKKPALWIIVIAVILCLVLGACLLTDSMGGIRLYEIGDSRNYSDLFRERESVSLVSFGKESPVDNYAPLLQALEDIRVNPTPIRTRSEDRDCTHQVLLDGRTRINFDRSYTMVWIDNGVKPTYSYLVTDPMAVMEIFQRYFGSGETDSGHKESAADWSITLSVKNVTAEGLTLICTPSGQYPESGLFYGAMYHLERYENGRWVNVEPIAEPLIWTTQAYRVPMDGSARIGINWSAAYGTLEPGLYRIGKGFSPPGDGDHSVYYAEFTVE